MSPADFKPGEKVHYAPRFGDVINGIVKSVSELGVYVVYHCDGKWEDYEHYTAGLTNPRYLLRGWEGDEKNENY